MQIWAKLNERTQQTFHGFAVVVFSNLLKFINRYEILLTGIHQIIKYFLQCGFRLAWLEIKRHFRSASDRVCRKYHFTTFDKTAHLFQKTLGSGSSISKHNRAKQFNKLLQTCSGVNIHIQANRLRHF